MKKAIGLLLAMVCVFCCGCIPKPGSNTKSTSQSIKSEPVKLDDLTKSEKENIAREEAKSGLRSWASSYGTFERGEVASFSGSGECYNASGKFWVSDKYGDTSCYKFDMTIRLYENPFGVVGQVDSFTARQVY